jgi:hypothetical protein
VQLALFDRNATGWLAFARIAMGYPLYIAAVGFGFWIVTRARRRIAAAGESTVVVLEVDVVTVEIGEEPAD